MNDSIHKRLTEHIRKTVGRHEVPYEPGSWEEFQRLQRQRQQRKPLVWFRYALAACLLLGILGVPVWFYLARQDVSEVATRQPKAGRVENKADDLLPKNRRADSVLVEKKASVRLQEESLASAKNGMNQNDTEWKNALRDQNESESQLVKNRVLLTSKRRLNGSEKPPKTGFRPKPDEESNAENRVAIGTKTAVLVTLPTSFEPIPARNRNLYRWSRPALGLPLTAGPENRVLVKTERATIVQKPVLGISLAPQSVYATGSSSAMAVGGGLYSEIPFSKRFSISTGLSVARQLVGTQAPEVFMVSTVPQRVATDIRLMAVDLPLNLRFRPVKNTKTGFYVEAGLSSLAFLNEHYADTYAQMKPVTILVMGSNGEEQPVTQYVTSREIINRSEPAFQRIYWGRIVNFSVGVERRISDRFRLSAEPYLKYPLGPFTRENLMLGSGGVSLRLGFQAGR